MKARNKIRSILTAIAVMVLFHISSASDIQQRIDSLKTILDTATIIETKLQLLSDISWHYKSMDSGEGLKYAQQGLEIAIKNKNTKYIADFYKNIGVLNKNIGKYEIALKSFQNSLICQEQLADKKGIAACYGNMGILYKDMGDLNNCLFYYEKALELFKKLNNKGAIAATYSNIALVYQEKKEYSKALDHFNLSMKLVEKDNKEGTNMLNLNIGRLYCQMGDYSKALESLKKAEIFLQQTNNRRELIILKQNMADIYLRKGDKQKALELLNESIKESKKMNLHKPLKHNYQLLSNIYEAMGKHKEALAAHRHYSLLNDSLINEDRIKSISEMEAKYKTEKKDKEIIELNKNKTINELEIAKKNSDLNRQQIITWSTIAVLSLVLLLSFYVYKNYREKQKANIIITRQKDLVEEKNKEITDSIFYAKRLQEAILPPQKLIDRFLPNSFVLYKPKDIVAGDFYWMEVVKYENGDLKKERKETIDKISDLVLIAAADSTGHGVPGAMVSVVCSNALNRAVKEFGITEPGKILDKVREFVIETFAHGDLYDGKSEMEVKDGMDISLCSLRKLKNESSIPTAIEEETEKIEIKWTGANNPLWYISSLQPESGIIEIKADKESIGKTDAPKPFTTHTLQLAKGSLLYLFTDGYADQFGGKKGKKFKYKQLLELIVKHSNKTMSEQKDILNAAIEKWKGDLEQVDDILIIGIRI